MNRKASSAFAAGMKRAEAAIDTAPAKGSGNWSKMAMDSMESSLQEIKVSLEVALTTLHGGILDGTIPVHVSVDQITDVVGTDRIMDSPDSDDATDSYASLVENIRKRGLRVPIRIRPTDPAWRPKKENPKDLGEQTFALQSGRRRLAACRDLGIEPTAFLSFGKDDAATEDLQERFFENAARKNLSLIEKLYSIGLIAESMKDLSQSEIATAIGANAAYVSRGIAVVQFFERLKQDLDLSHTTAREIDETLKRYREEKTPSANPAAKRSREHRKKLGESSKLPFERRTVGKTRLTLKANVKGERILSMKGRDLDDDTIGQIIDLLDEKKKI